MAEESSSDRVDSLFDGSAGEQPRARGPRDPGPPPGGVLIVDDAPLFRAKVRAILASWRYPLMEAENGRLALQLAQEGKPRLILLDIHMPGMDGLETLASLRADEGLKTTPVVILTGDGDSKTVKAALDRGADDYLLKGSELEEIRRRLTRHLGPPPEGSA